MALEPLATPDPERHARLLDELISAGRLLDAQGWVPATSGNLSARLADGVAVITVSGRHKGRLSRADFLRMDLQGASLEPGRRPSAEAGLHAALYRRFPRCGAVLHAHSPSATVISLLAVQDLRLSGLELLKAFSGVTTHVAEVVVPVLPNDQDIPRLTAEVEAWFDDHPQAPVHGYLIAGHGLYVWGETVADAERHMEAFDFLFRCELELRRLRA